MYDALGAFRNLQFIYWTQRLKNIEVGDVVYIYLGAPVSRIVYKSEVIEKDVPFIDEVLNDTPCRKAKGNIVSVTKNTHRYRSVPPPL